MTSVYDVIDRIKSFLRENPTVNYVSFGNVLEVALDKTAIYPLAHFSLSDTTVNSNNLAIQLDFLFLDIVDYSKDYNPDDAGNRQDDTNLVDVYNTQLQVANALISELRRGDMYRDKFQLLGDTVCRPFRDRFENELAGWSLRLTIQVPNNLSIC